MAARISITTSRENQLQAVCLFYLSSLRSNTVHTRTLAVSLGLVLEVPDLAMSAIRNKDNVLIETLQAGTLELPMPEPIYKILVNVNMKLS